MSSTAADVSPLEPLLSDAKPGTPSPSRQFFLRPGRLSDVPTLALYQQRAYWLSPVNRFIAPGAEQHPDHLARRFRQNLRRQLYKPNVLFLVACLTSQPETAVGFGQFARQGNDSGAREYVASCGLLERVWMGVIQWYFYFYDRVDNFIRPDGATDPRAMEEFISWNKKDDEKYWSSHPERVNKWYANTIVIDPQWQGKGVGKMLMGEAIRRAQSERVIIGLSSSPQGEFLYRRLGFEMLGDFYKRVPSVGDEDKGGGVMIWYPEGWEGPRHSQ